MVFAITTIGNVGFSATLPFYAVYLVHRNVPLSVIGAVYLATGVLLLLGQIVSGRLVDSIGPKKIVIGSFVFSFVWALLLWRLIEVSAPVGWLLFLYPVFSLLRSIPSPATSAIVAGQTGGQIWTGFSFLNIGNNLGFAIGPAIAGILSQSYGFATVFLLAAVTAVVADVVALLLPKSHREKSTGREPDQIGVEEKKANTRQLLSWRDDRVFIIFLLLVFAAFFSIGYEITPMSVYVSEFLGFSNSEIGYLFTTNGLVIVLAQLPLTRLFERSYRTAKSRGLVIALVFSSILAAIAYLIVSISHSFPQLELAMVILTFGEIFQTVPSQIVTTLFSDAKTRGTYQGYYNAVTSAGRSVAYYIGPASFELFSSQPYLSWVLIAVFSLFVGLGFFVSSPSLEREYSKREKKEVNFER